MLGVIELCRSYPALPFPPGDVILREGDRTGRLYVLADGRVSIRKGATEVARVDTPGAMFGEMSVLLDLPHSASVVAIGQTSMHVIPDAATFMASTPHAALAAARVLAQRLFDATTYLADLKAQYEGAQGQFGMVDQILDSLMNQPRQATADAAPRGDDPRL
jgi:CRP-like cAMP-binding protein